MLKAYDHYGTLAELAKHIGYGRTQTSAFIRNKITPPIAVAFWLEETLGIPAQMTRPDLKS